MRASELAKMAKVSKDTLRYYESIKLISAPKRKANGYREYSPQHLIELKFIHYAKSVGFPLNKIKVAIPHLQSPNPQCPKLNHAIEEQIEHIDNKIEELNEAKRTLRKWIHVK